MAKGPDVTTVGGSQLRRLVGLLRLGSQPEDEPERRDDQRDRGAEREYVAFSLPVHDLAQEAHAEQDDDNPDEVSLQVGEIVHFEPAWQRQLVVDKELIEPESHDVEHRPQQDDIDDLDQLDAQTVDVASPKIIGKI